MFRPLYPWEIYQVPIVQEAEWSPGPVWISAENLVPTGIRFRTVQPVAIQTALYRLLTVMGDNEGETLA
jgi:hypothetical protein